MSLVGTPDLPVPPPAPPGASTGAGRRSAPAAYGRRTWTHGGGPGSAARPAHGTTRAGRTRPSAAGGAGPSGPATVPLPAGAGA